MEDPGLIVRSEDGTPLSKIGMAGRECCFVLRPHTDRVRIVVPETGDALILSRIEKIVISETDGVSELNGGPDAPGPSPFADGMHWQDGSGTLVLVRKSPHQVGLLSICFREDVIDLPEKTRNDPG